MPPRSLSATTDKRGIRLNWTNAGNFRKETHIVEVWRGKRSNFNTYFPNFDAGTENMHNQSRSNTLQMKLMEITLYYWIRYALPSNRPTDFDKFSDFHPKRTAAVSE